MVLDGLQAKEIILLAATLGDCLAVLGGGRSDEDNVSPAPYQGFEHDRVLIRKTVRRKSALKASPPEAIAASVRIFERVPFLFKTREEVLKLLGDPATACDDEQRAGFEPDGPLFSRFDLGYGGWPYTIGFSGGKADRVKAEPIS